MVDLKEVQEVAKIFKKGKEDINYLITELNKIPKSKIKEQLDEYSKSKKIEKINEIRFFILEKSSEDQLSKSDIDNKYNEIIKTFPKHSLKSWKENFHFKVLYSLFYYYHKDSISNTLNKFANEIKKGLEYQNSLKLKKKIVDFNGSRNFGDSGAWIALYPFEFKSQKECNQLFMHFTSDGISLKIYNHKLKKDITENVTLNYESFKIEEIITYFSNNIYFFKKDNYGKIYEEIDISLHKDFKNIFEDINQADFFFEILKEINQRLNINYESDSVVLSKPQNNNKLNLIIASWYILIAQNKKIGITLNTKRKEIINSLKPIEFDKPPFTTTIHGDSYKMYWITKDEFINNKTQIFEDIGQIFSHFRNNVSKSKKKHNTLIKNMVFDSQLRKEILINGIGRNELIGEVENHSEINNILDKNKQIILYGPPGTGKTYNINTIIKNHLLNNRNLFEKRTDEELNDIEFIQNENINNNFWWIATNPNIWKNSKNGEIVSFKYGNIKRNYKDLKKGDFVFGYETTPNKRISWYGRILEVTDDFEENKDEAFKIKIINSLNNDNLTWEKLSKENELINSEPIRNISRGTLFKLTKNEGDFLLNKCGINVESKNIRRIEFITFHQSYSYEEFIEGIRPKLNEMDSEDIKYEIKPGIFKEIVDKAKKNQNKNFYLVIDEINRGNISKIFGEIITLLENDKRDVMRIKLPYSQEEEFFIPKNLYIIATMNTADKSIASLDIALRRRFGFVEMLPKYELLKKGNENISKENNEFYNSNNIELDKLLENLNLRIEYLLDKDQTIGHSYFMKVNSLDSLKEIFYNEIIPLLEEYFYGDVEKLRLILGKDFFEEIKIDKIKRIFGNNSSLDINEELIKLKDIKTNNIDIIPYLEKIVNLEKDNENEE